MRHVLDPLAPELLVQLRVKADVRGAHRLLRKLDDGLDRPRRPRLEGTPVHALVQVDGVFARDDISEGGALAGLFGLVSPRLSASPSCQSEPFRQ